MWMRSLYFITTLLLLYSMAKFSYSCPKTCFCQWEEEVICEFGPENVEIPTNLSLKLKNLTINGGKFMEIRRENFSTYPLLEKIHLNANSIYTILPQTFANFTHLRILTVQYNFLRILDSYSFSGLNGLTQLMLVHNEIRYIRKHAFYNSRNIKHFDLRDNPVENIASYAFSNVQQIGYLHMPHRLRHIESYAFHGLTDVHFIELRHWLAHDDRGAAVATHTFRGLSHVTSMLIDNSNLGVLREHSFSGLSNVNVLSIQRCTIRKIKMSSFRGMVNVKLLEMTNNLIWNMEPKAWLHMHNHMTDNNQTSSAANFGTNLKFVNNRMDCTCHNAFIYVEMAKLHDGTEVLQHNYCNVPPELENKPLSAVSKKYRDDCRNVEFRHNRTESTMDNDATSTTYANFLLTSNVLLLCYVIEILMLLCQ